MVLAVITAASTGAAQDTLRLESMRVVDVCSKERRWLLAVNVGAIQPTDSLVSFDITIGYDKSKLLPTDVLKEGTLSANMAYEPVLNTVVENEMRISGGNIVKPVSGNLPLVAVAGEFTGTCNEVDSLTFPWPATFNEEFKKKFSIKVTSAVQSIAVPKKYIGLGYSSIKDSVEVPTDSVERFGVLLKGDISSDSVYVLHAKYDTTLLEIEPRAQLNIEVEDAVHDKDGTSWSIRHIDATRYTEFDLRWKRQDVATSIVRLTTSMTQSCSCIQPAEVDSLVVVREKPIVSVSSIDEHIDGIRIVNDNLVIQCDHEEMKTVSIFTLTGENLITALLTKNQQTVSVSSIPSGPHIVRLTCGNNNHVKLILK